MLPLFNSIVEYLDPNNNQYTSTKNQNIHLNLDHLPIQLQINPNTLIVEVMEIVVVKSIYFLYLPIIECPRKYTQLMTPQTRVLEHN